MVNTAEHTVLLPAHVIPHDLSAYPAETLLKIVEFFNAILVFLGWHMKEWD